MTPVDGFIKVRTDCAYIHIRAFEAAKYSQELVYVIIIIVIWVHRY